MRGEKEKGGKKGKRRGKKKKGRIAARELNKFTPLLCSGRFLYLRVLRLAFEERRGKEFCAFPRPS